MRYIKTHLPERQRGGRARQYTLAFLLVNYCRAVSMVATSDKKVATSPKPNV